MNSINQVKHPTKLLILIIVLLAAITAVPHLWANSIAYADETNKSAAESPDFTQTNCRYGIASYETPVAWYDTLNAGIYMNFRMRADFEDSTDAEFARVLWVTQKKDDSGNYLPQYIALWGNALALEVQKYPGSLWLIGNEIDRVGQGEIHAEIYARAYHDMYHTIKQTDPTAQVAISGLVQFTPNREQYLTMIWDSYLQQYGEQMPVDVWNMHAYILSELDDDGNPSNMASTALGTDPSDGMWNGFGNTSNCNDAYDNTYCRSEHDSVDIFIEQVTSMRSWMKERGQKEKPLIISEFGLLLPYWENDSGQCGVPDEYGSCYDPARAADYLRSTVQWLETAADPALGYGLDNNKLVQQWMWYSLNESHIGSASNLLEDGYEDQSPGSQTALTLQGTTFQEEATNDPLVNNLLIDSFVANNGNPIHINANGSATFELAAIIRNNGNTQVTSPVTVTFYEDVTRIIPIGSVTLDPLIQGCARAVHHASIEWTVQGEGIHRFYAVVDSADSINETDESDNSNSGVVFVGGEVLAVGQVQMNVEQPSSALTNSLLLSTLLFTVTLGSILYINRRTEQ